jgi:integrase
MHDMAKKRSDGLRQKQVTINGKRHVFYGHSEREILQKIREYKEDATRGRRFEEVADEWAEEHLPTLAYNTQKGYKPALQRIVERFGDKLVKDITPRNISAFLDAFAKTGMARKTVTTQLLVTNLIMDRAVLDGDIDYNPCAAVKVPKGLRKDRREAPTEEEIDIVKHSLDKPFGLFAFFLLYTGCRRGEALALTYGDIDRRNKTISITKSVYHDSNKPKIKAPKTEAGTRQIVLLDVLADALPTGKKSDLLFPGADGGLMSDTYCRHRWNAYCKATGLSITPHQLRHAYATILYEAGISDKDAQELLGHANISTTRDIYTHISKSRKQSVLNTLNQRVG